MRKAILCMVKTDIHDHVAYLVKLRELEKLLTTLGYNTIKKIVQSRLKPTVNYCVGKGKAYEIKDAVDKNKPDIVVFYNILTSKQRYNLEKLFGAPVYDRYDVVLEIFKEAATDKLSKLQIELASIEKEFPYVKLRASMKYLRHKAGFRGPGEYAYHKTISALHKRIKRIRGEIEKIKKRKKMQIDRIKEMGAPIVCISGYYNAGKTSLFNELTGCRKPVSDMPFTTLSSKYSSIFNGNLYLVDTIGFVLDQDPRLIQSFELNLMDIRSSNRLLVMFDASDRREVLKLKVDMLLRMYREIGVDDKITFVFNKIDKIKERRIEELKKIESFVGDKPVFYISVRQDMNVEELVKHLKDLS
ncbi:MAG: hypothetical protein DRN81_00355 [Thermoproteota archaeon]|nr:MAG: hypothetical protein DRN81_00355 [Candidatus Korarchaeota archaeon]